MDLKSIISRGYFPIELPPPFTTQHLATNVETNPSILKVFENFKNPTRIITHDIPRYGIYRRTLGVQNPIYYTRLAKTISDNWLELKQLAGKSNYSFSKPIEDKDVRSITPENPIGGFVPQIMHTRANARYILKTDVSQCYASIYTHSIPWAIHTKSKAKKDYSDTLVGNLIDKLSRYSNHGQTVGIPIGSDISFLIGEIILSAVDEELGNILPYLRGHRYIDDYEFSFKTYEDANEALTQIRRSLQQFELSINERKTSILELPVLIEETWVSELRSFKIEDRLINHGRQYKRQRIDLIRYFDKSFQLVKKNPTDHVLNYSVQRLREVKIHRKNWGLVQDFLLQCMMIETGTIRSALFMLKEYSERDSYKINIEDLTDVINHHAWQQSRHGYLNEVAWSIWAMIFWELPMKDKVAQEVSKVDDSFVALLALDAQSRGLADGLDVEMWERYLKKEELNGLQWLLSYEAKTQGWLNGETNHISEHDCFNTIAKAGVIFYDKDKMGDLVEHKRPNY